MKANNKWHKVKIAVDGGPYHLGYRRGYFDDGRDTSTPSRNSRAVLRAHGESFLAPDGHSEPIIFEARLLPSSATQPASTPQSRATTHAPKRNELTYGLHYSVPLEVFTRQIVHGDTQISIGAAILAFNHFGRLTGHVAQKLTFTLNAQELKANVTKLGFEQQINLPKGEDYLYIALWDMSNGRLGTLQLPLDVKKTK